MFKRKVKPDTVVSKDETEPERERVRSQLQETKNRLTVLEKQADLIRRTDG